MTIFLFSLLWIVAGVYSYGFVIGNFKTNFPWLPVPILLAIASGLLGPFALIGHIITVCTSTDEKFTNWSLVPYTRQQRWEIFLKDYPELGEVYNVNTFDK